jgi:integrase-like protein
MRKAPADPRLTDGPACGTVGRARDMERRYGPSAETFTLLGAGSGGHSGAALQHPYGRELSLLGAPLHSVPREAPPRELGESQVGEFLTHHAVDRKVSASTQNQALNALVFLYKDVLERPLGDVGGVVRARRPQRLPVVLHVREVKALLRHLEGSHWLAACLMYGSGLRLMEALRLRSRTSTLSTVPSWSATARARRAA